MDSKNGLIFVLFFCVIVLLFFLLMSNSSNSKINESNIVSQQLTGRDSKEQNVRSYVMEMQEKQSRMQRKEVIKLLTNTLEKGKKNTAKVESASDAPAVCEKANDEITGNSEEEKAQRAVEYLNSEIEYDWGNIITDATGRPRIKSIKYPTEVLKEGKGLCGEVANTFLLFSDCLNIPVFFIYGGGHAWNVFVQGENVVEMDVNQGCFGCDMGKLNYPPIGVCSTENCISISDVSDLSVSRPNIFEQTTHG